MIESQRKIKPVWFILLILCALVAIVKLSQLNAPPDIIPWRTDYVAGGHEAALARKNVFLYFTADWCDACQHLKHTTWANKDVEKALRAFVPIKIDVDQNPDLAMQYGAHELPLFIVVDPEWKSMRASTGAMEPDEFLAWLSQRG